ncbi:NAD(P)H-dependent oxidoreductase [Vibrio paucivorans]
MSRVLVISGHPDLEASYTNSVILQELSQQVDNIEIRRLDTLYPNYNINVEAEQAAALEADVIILQFPFYWYSTPALMKKWIDDVFTFNFAYGPEGDKLKGKDFILSLTIGGPEESYNPLGYNHFTVEEFLRPLQQLAYLAGMNYCKPVYTHRMVYIPNVYNELGEVQARARDHVGRLIESIESHITSDEVLLSKFVSTWFEKFDVLPEQDEYFTQSLAEDVVMTMPEGKFEGHTGFRDWYAIARTIFKPNCQHDVEQLEVKSSGKGYQLNLRIRLKAETYADSVMHGETIELSVDETWQVSLDSQGKVTIHDYSVVPLA